jgi:hypothetical protein
VQSAKKKKNAKEEKGAKSCFFFSLIENLSFFKKKQNNLFKMHSLSIKEEAEATHGSANVAKGETAEEKKSSCSKPVDRNMIKKELFCMESVANMVDFATNTLQIPNLTDDFINAVVLFLTILSVSTECFTPEEEEQVKQAMALFGACPFAACTGKIIQRMKLEKEDMSGLEEGTEAIENKYFRQLQYLRSNKMMRCAPRLDPKVLEEHAKETIDAIVKAYRHLLEVSTNYECSYVRVKDFLQSRMHENNLKKLKSLFPGTDPLPLPSS